MECIFFLVSEIVFAGEPWKKEIWFWLKSLKEPKKISCPLQSVHKDSLASVISFTFVWSRQTLKQGAIFHYSSRVWDCGSHKKLCKLLILKATDMAKHLMHTWKVFKCYLLLFFKWKSKQSMDPILLHFIKLF